MIKKYPTDCCALCQLSISDEDSLSDIKEVIAKIKRQSESNWYRIPGKEFGQRNIFVITTEDEKHLVRRLKLLGFKETATLNRRTGYPVGNIKMHILSW